jgi:U3 small nucleolar RNA-associated protein 22
VPLCTLFDAFVRFETQREGEGQVVMLPGEDEMFGLLTSALVDTRRVEAVEGLGGGLFGLVLAPASEGGEMHAYRKVDVRPDEVEAPAFKAFWGPKAELRRFKNGRIVESLVWTGGLGVIDEMVNFACARHFAEHVKVTAVLAQLEGAAGLLGIDTGATRAIAVFNELSSSLRKAKGLPLTIATVQAVSPYLRRTAVLPVRPNAAGKFVEALDILAVFERSGAWPDDSLAMASAKTGFYLALKAGLAELGIASRPTVSFIDILMGGFVFRLRVRVDKEKLIPAMEKETRQRLIWETESRVELHDAMRNVRSAIFGDTARLFKRWLSSHVLLCEFGDRREELVELLVTRVVSGHGGRSPRSVLSGFCQSLHLLAEFPWEVAPLVVPLTTSEDDDEDRGGDNSAARENEDRGALYECAIRACSRNSAGSGGSSMCVATTLDPEGSWFFSSSHGPERVILKRASAAASAALAFLDGTLSDSSRSAANIAWSALFRFPGGSFSHTIALDRSWVPRSSLPLSRGHFYTSHTVSRLDVAIVSLDPVERLAGLLKQYLGGHAVFLYDLYGGSRIYIVWRPAAEAPIPFSLQLLPFMAPCAETNRLIPNKSEMICCVKRLGGAMIKSVE